MLAACRTSRYPAAKCRSPRRRDWRLLDTVQAQLNQSAPTRAGVADASTFVVSPDGYEARYLIQTKFNPFSNAAIDQLNSIVDTAREPQSDPALVDATISMAGFPATLQDTRDYYNRDIQFIIGMTVLVVLLILIVRLRAIVAPLYLIVSATVSYLSALGIGVITFQFILGQQLHWSVPGLTFIVLVAVGADRNMPLISRMRDECPDDVRSGVVRTMGSTGAVITAVGLVFAASMFALLLAGISTMAQAASSSESGCCWIRSWYAPSWCRPWPCWSGGRTGGRPEGGYSRNYGSVHAHTVPDPRWSTCRQLPAGRRDLQHDCQEEVSSDARAGRASPRHTA